MYIYISNVQSTSQLQTDNKPFNKCGHFGPVDWQSLVESSSDFALPDVTSGDLADGEGGQGRHSSFARS